MRCSRLTLTVFALGFGFSCLGTPSAQAGFLWQPPSEEEAGGVLLHGDEDLDTIPGVDTDAAAPTSQIAPLPAVEAGAPVPLYTDHAAPVQNMGMKSRTIGQAGEIPVVPAEPYLSAKPQVEETSKPLGRPAITLEAGLEAEDESALAPVYGFGSDLPLALALRQIVPPSYGYVLEDGMDMGKRVSWSGNGQPWSAVIRDMVAPMGLDVVVLKGKVYIKSPENLPVSVIDTIAMTGQRAARPVARAVPISIPAKQANTPVALSMPESTPLAKQEEEPAPYMPGRISSPMSLDAPVQPKGGLGVINPQPLTENNTTNPAPRRIQITDPGQNENVQPHMPTRLTPPTIPQKSSTPDHHNDRVDINWNTPHEHNEMKREAAAKAPLNSAPSMPQPLALLAPENQPVIDGNLWEAQKGESLRKVLLGWGQREGLALIWQAPQDYLVNSNVIVTGSIEDALETLMSYGLGDGAAHLQYEVRQSSGRPGVILIQG